MTLARRLLLGGGGSFPTPRGSGVLSVGAVSTITDDTKYNAWPSVCLMANGSLLASYAKSNAHNLDNSGIVVRRISADGGATWGSEATIASDASYGNINPGVASLASGRVLCSYNYFDYPIENPDYVRTKYSDDYGSTWSSMYVVDSSFSSWNANGGMPLELGDGTVLLPIYGLDIGGTYASAHVLFSADDGATFGGEVTIADGDSDGRHYYEPTLVRVSDSRILCLMRTTAGTGDVYQSVSTDGGSTWSAPAVAFGGYSTPNAIRLRSMTLVAIVRGNAAAEVEAFTSIDDGASWDSQGVVDTGYYESEYGCPVQLADNSILVVYSVQPTSSTSNADVKQVYLSEV